MKVGNNNFNTKGKHKTINLVEGKYRPTKPYNTWRNMILRCYDINHSSFCSYGEKGVTVCDEWHNFQSFAEWYINQKGYEQGYHLDKDLKLKGNKVYAPEYCSLIPVEINCLLHMNKSRGNKTGCTGVVMKGGKYFARCKIGKGVNQRLGTFSCKESAKQAYIDFKRKRLKELADKYLELGIICKSIHLNIINFEIN